MVRTQIQLTEEQAKALKRISAAQHLSVAELIRRAIDVMVRTSAMVDPEERLRRSLDIIGKFSSGKRDISKKHDVYLSGDYGK
ncbi:MAG: ribbon-helix-helix protein, CopG family [Candidatus Aminicenantes bacterium]|nr:ribbon-helix-helix protein, CopG family [Candidatus Aminicenantes bacterium]